MRPDQLIDTLPLGDGPGGERTNMPGKPGNRHSRPPHDRLRIHGHPKPTRRSSNRGWDSSADPARDRALLSAEEEHALAERIKRGDADARKQLIVANLRLVVGVARQYRSGALSFDDLVQEGNLGLIRASQDFDPSGRDARFSTYALLWIKAFVYRALIANDSMIRVPRRLFALRKRYRQAIDALGGPDRTDACGRQWPGVEQVAREIGISPRQIKTSRPTSIERETRSETDQDGATVSISEMIVDRRRPDDDAANQEERLLLEAALRRLNPVEAWVLRERYGLSISIAEEDNWATPEPHPARFAEGDPTSASRPNPSGKTRSYFYRSYLELGQDCGLSSHRIHQVERAALNKLRDALGHRLVQVI